MTTLKSGLDTAYAGCFAKSQGRLYFVNDFNPMQVVERGDAACADAGIDYPTGTLGAPSQTAGLCTVGVHLVRYRYKNSKSGYLSDPSIAASVTVASVATLTFDIGTSGTDIIRSTDARVDLIVIEMTTAGGSEYYQATTVANSATTVAVSVADTSLVLLVTAAFYGDFGHQPPPLCSLIVEHRGRLFTWGATERTATGTFAASTTVSGTGFSTEWAGRLLQKSGDTAVYRITASTATAITISETYAGSTGAGQTFTVFSPNPDLLGWSRAGYPESHKPAEWARRVLQNQADKPAGMASFYNDLYLFGQRTQRRLIYTDDPATGRIIHVPTEMGLYNQQCLVEANGKLYGFGRSGAWVIEGLLPKHLSRRIDRTVFEGNTTAGLAALDTSKIAQFHGVYEPSERCVYWFYVETGDTYPKTAMVYDVDRDEWLIREYRQAIRASTLAAGGTNAVRALLADENSSSWYLTADRFDGVPSSMTSGVVTCGVGSTTTVLQVNEALGTLTGAMLYHPTTFEERRITSNTGSAITLASALSGAPSNGTELYVGSIAWKIRTKWESISGLSSKQYPYVVLQMVPGSSSGKLTLKFYADYATNPSTFTALSGDTFPPGVTWTDGASFATVDLDGGNSDGVITFPVPVRWSRVISAELSQTKPLGALKVIGFGIVLNDTKSQSEERD